MAGFCGKCGAPTDASGRCPNCDRDAGVNGGPAAGGSGLKVSGSFAGRVPAGPDPDPAGGKPMKAPKAKKQKTPPAGSGDRQKKGSPVLKPVLIGLGVLLAAALVLGGLHLLGVIRLPFLGNREDAERYEPPADYLVEIPDADEYYAENGTIVSKTPAKGSPNLHTEEEAIRNLEDRGFNQYEVTSDWTMDGELIPYTDSEGQDGANAVGGNPNEKHPSYQTYYITARGELWSVTEVNGAVFAVPVSYNMESGRGVQVIFTEGSTLISYYSESGTFYETIPNGRTVLAFRVDRIDAETLEQLTMEEIDRR